MLATSSAASCTGSRHASRHIVSPFIELNGIPRSGIPFMTWNPIYLALFDGGVILVFG